jgi:arabinose-5-phosphate isomerase
MQLQPPANGANDPQSLLHYARAAVNAEIAALQQLQLGDSYLRAVELIYEQVHQKGGKLVVSGMGKAGEIGMNIATTFSSTGTPAAYLRPSEAQHGDLGLLQPQDLLLAVSNSGRTREIVALVQLARRLHAGLPLLVITGRPDSPLAAEAQAVLSTGNPAEVCPFGLTPTTSTTCMTVIGDVLVLLMMQRIGFTQAAYALRHHSGYLGQRARGEAE